MRQSNTALAESTSASINARYASINSRISSAEEFAELFEWDLADFFRSIHGEREDASWILHRKGKVVARRFDHIFASSSLGPTKCEYLHDLREAGLSDHSAIETVFELSRVDRIQL